MHEEVNTDVYESCKAEINFRPLNPIKVRAPESRMAGIITEGYPVPLKSPNQENLCIFYFLSFFVVF